MKNNTKPVLWSIQVGDSNTIFTTKVEIFLPEIEVTNFLTCTFRVDDLQGRHIYGMIMWREILSELNMDLCFSKNTARENGDKYKGCTNSMKYLSKIKFNS